LQRDGHALFVSANIIFLLMALLTVMYKLIENSGKESTWKIRKEFLGKYKDET
jgi:hypothetical protein